MILIFDYYDTLIHNKSMDFNRGLIGLWEKYYKGKCSLRKSRRLERKCIFISWSCINRERNGPS